MIYIVYIFDIKDIVSKKEVFNFLLEADCKSQAMDLAHTKAQEMYPEVKKLLEIKEVQYDSMR